MIVRWCATLLLGLLLGASAVVVAQDTPVLTGSVIKVIDGDTITVQLQSGPIKVRLDAIDAPESNQPGGNAATAAKGSERAKLPAVVDSGFLTPLARSV